MLTLYINGLFFNGTGIARYYKNLVKEFALQGIKIVTTIPIKQKEKFNSLFGGFENIQPIFVEYEKFSPKGFIKEGLLLRKLEKKIDLFFFTQVNVPFYIPRKSVVVIHDFIPFTNFWEGGTARRLIFKFYLDRAIDGVSQIICVSRSTQRDLIKYRPIIAEKSNVVYHFLDDKFYTRTSSYPKLLSEKYILYVGARKRHKNVQALLKAFKMISSKIPHQLVLAGPKERERDEVDKVIAELNIEGRVIQTTSPTDEELLSLYKHADLFVFPSLIEGFGLPPLEAVAMGCPVVLSDIEVHKEVFGEAGLYFNPHSPEDMAYKILWVLHDREFRETLLHREQERIKIFDKVRIINQYIELFNSVIESK